MKYYLHVFYRKFATISQIKVTSNPFCLIGRLNFQYVQDILKILPRLFLSFEITVITLNEQSRRVIFAVDLMNSLIFLIRHDHYDAITETKTLSFDYSLLISSLFSLDGFRNNAKIGALA